MKKILISFLLFIFTSIIFIYIFFPYQTVLSYYTNMFITQNRLPITYSVLDANYSKAIFKNIVIKNKSDIDLGDLVLNYSLFSLVKRTLDGSIKGDFIKSNFKLSMKGIEYTALINLDNLKGFDLPKGKVELIGNYGIKDNVGSVKLSSDSLVLNTSLGIINLTSISGFADYKNYVITINKFTSLGKNKIDLKGKIYINKNNLILSRLNIKGKVNFSGLKQNVDIRGSFAKPIIRLN